MESIIDGLKPELVWKHFETLTKIPRPSKHEEQMQQIYQIYHNCQLDIDSEYTGHGWSTCGLEQAASGKYVTTGDTDSAQLLLINCV